MVRTIRVGRKRARTIAVLATLPLAAAGAFTVAGMASASTPALGEHLVTICHRTGSEAGGNAANGYSIITVDVASLFGPAGHFAHEQVGNGPGGDVIPSFTYNGVTYPAKNGGDITNCLAPSSPPSS